MNSDSKISRVVFLVAIAIPVTGLLFYLKDDLSIVFWNLLFSSLIIIIIISLYGILSMKNSGNKALTSSPESEWWLFKMCIPFFASFTTAIVAFVLESFAGLILAPWIFIILGFYFYKNKYIRLSLFVISVSLIIFMTILWLPFI